MTEKRQPDWAKWKLCPEVKLWEAVALWLDIDPDLVKHNPTSWMAGDHLFEESSEFKRRLDIAKANFGNAKALRPTYYVSGSPSDSRVSLGQFADWAVSLEGFSAARPFHEIASTAPVREAFAFDPDSPTYPEELDIAHIAWRAVSQRPDNARSPKEQLKAWLEKRYPDLSVESRERIATVANWGKRGGRPTRGRQ